MKDLTEKKKTKIFIADDESWYLEGLKDALEAEGYEVIIERRMTGTRALEIMKDPKLQIDILILDIMMDLGSELADELSNDRTETGIIVCKKIRDEIKWRFPIICLTVINDESILNQMRQMGCVILKKADVGIKEILESVRNAEESLKDLLSI